MSRAVDFDAYGFSETNDGEMLPTFVVKSTVPPNEISGEMNLAFGAGDREGQLWFLVLAPDKSVLAGAPATDETREFVSEMVNRKRYRVVVEFVEEIGSVPEDELWFEMESVGELPSSVTESVYVEDASVEGGFQAQLRSILSRL